MPNPASSLATALRKSLGDAKGDVREQLIALSGSDAPFLAAPADPSFATAWPEALALDTEGFTEAFLALATAAQQLDPRLQKRCDRLVPKKIAEHAFWRNYFGHAHAVVNGLAGGAPTSAPAAAPAAAAAAATTTAAEPERPDTSHLTPEEIATYAEAGLPPPRPPAKRRFAAAKKLQMEGELKAVQMLSFVTEAATMVGSPETSALINAAAEKGGMQAASTELLQFQLELMETHGIDRRFGCTQLDGQRVFQRFPRDAALHNGIRNFANECHAATQRAVQRAAQRAAADPALRRLRPAAKLQREGEVRAETLLRIVAAIEALLDTEETRAELVQVVRRGEPPQAHLFRLQREYLESVGIEQDFGMQALWTIPARFADADGAPRQAHKRLRELCEALPREATIDASKPQPRPLAQRRFAPCADGGALQVEGTLSRDVVVRFCKACTEMLMAPETIALLAAAEAQREAPSLSVAWQREMLEHLGVEQDFGCRALSSVPQRFEGDQEVLRAFKGFQMACVVSLKKAQQERDAAKAGQAADGVAGLAVADTAS